MVQTYDCPCGATVRYRQDMRREATETGNAWRCVECGTPVPGVVAERLSHRHPS